MGLEIERKFLLANDDWRALAQQTRLLRQGYLSRDPKRVVRVRIDGEQGFLTIKGKTEGISRGEWEYPLPLAEAQQLLQLCDAPLVEKYRSKVSFGGMLWEVDEFLGANAPLIIAEIELDDEAQEFARPPWLGMEVSHDARYTNANLSHQPYAQWG